MPPIRDVLYGPSFQDLQTEAFAKADTIASDQIRSILYIESNDRARRDVSDRWAQEHQPLRLNVVDVDDIVNHCYEQLFGVANTLDRQQRLRLIEQALIELDTDGTLDGAASLLENFSQFFAAVEVAGIETPDELATALAETTLPTRIRSPTVDAYRRFTRLRDEHTSARTKTRSERIAAVATADTPLQTCYPSVDVVVVSDRRSLPSVEFRLLERLAEEFAFIGTLPAVHESPDGRGADREISDVFEAYRALGCEFEYVPPDDSNDSLLSLTQQLYIISERDHPLHLESLEWHAAPTPEREVRHVARSVRRQLADGVPPDDIAVVVPGLISYREQFADIFDAYDIPYVSYANKVLQQTHVGEAVLRLVELCKLNPQADTLVELLANPVVSIESVDPATVADLNRRLPSQDCDHLLAEIPESAATEQLEQLLADCQSVRETAATTAVDTFTALLNQLDIESRTDSRADTGDRIDAALERRTVSQVTRILESVAEFAETGLVTEPLDRIERALSDVRISAPRQDATGRVELMGLFDARGKAFDYVYLVGATANALPAASEQPLFFDQLEEAIPALQTTAQAVVESDPQLDARYQFVTLIASAQTAEITTPEATTDDESVLPSAVLNEVTRVTGIEPQDPRSDHGTTEDIQRTLARYETTEGLFDAVEACESTGDLTAAQADRLTTGARCAAHRGGIEITDHDGQLAPETVQAVFPPDKLTRLSPSRLKGYAKCGFAYYMNRGLGLDAPDDITTEPDNLDLGDFVHETLDRFFARLQEQPGDPVDLTAYDLETLEVALLEAAHDAEAVLDLPYESAFYTTWKSHLLAGLATPAENDYYDPSTTGQPAPESEHSRRDRGFFLRFLETEYDRDSDLFPAWFETPVGFDTDERTFELPLPDGTSAEISGFIDRIDIAAGSSSTIATVIDYKTGRTNLKRTTEGVEFQLPLYALAAKRGIAEMTDHSPDDIAVDAHFYDIDVPDGVSLKGPLSERVGDGPTDPAYQAFLAELTPQRIQQINDAIQEGAFHPSVLGSREAGCKYCDYKDTCDVRHHDRHDVIEHIDDENVTAYVANRGRDIDVGELLSGGDDT